MGASWLVGAVWTRAGKKRRERDAPTIWLDLFLWSLSVWSLNPASQPNKFVARVKWPEAQNVAKDFPRAAATTTTSLGLPPPLEAIEFNFFERRKTAQGGSSRSSPSAARLTG